VECNQYDQQRKQLEEELKKIPSAAQLFESLQQPLEKVAFLLAGKGGRLCKSESSRNRVSAELAGVLAVHLSELWKERCTRLDREREERVSDPEASDSDEVPASADIRRFFRAGLTHAHTPLVVVPITGGANGINTMA
jgi:hypothetical protein